MNGKRVIIVGAGPGGLTSAMILARRGFAVTVFEKDAVAGGRNAPLRLDGYTFDTGPTFLMMDFILRDMFEEAGRRAEDYLAVKKLNPMYRLKFSDFEIHPTNDQEAMRRQLSRLFPGSEQGYDAFLRVEQARFEKIFPCLQKPYSRLADFMDPKLIRALPHLSLGKTMFAALGDYFNEEKLRLSFTFQSKYLGMSAWKCPALFNIIPFVEHVYGIYHVIGGLQAISQAMAKIVIEEGGRVHTNSPVARMLTEGRRISGVQLANGDEHTADHVIVNADFAYAMTHLFPEGSLRKYTRSRIAGMRYSCSTFMLYLGVDKVYDVPHHNIIFAHDYKTNVEDIFAGGRLSRDNSFYIQNASVTDSTLAPAGCSTLYVLVPVPNNKSRIDWDAEKAAFRDHMLAQIAQKTELKDLRDHIVVEKIITPRDWEQVYNVYRGATFNLSHHLGQMLYLRPRNKFEEFDNCYLVGGGTHPGSGLPTIYESARIAANLLCRACRVPFKPPSTLASKHSFA